MDSGIYQQNNQSNNGLDDNPGADAFDAMYQQEFQKDYSPPPPKDVPNRPMNPVNYDQPLPDSLQQYDPVVQPASNMPVQAQPQPQAPKKKRGSNLMCSCVMILLSLIVLGGIAAVSLGLFKNGGFNLNFSGGNKSSSSSSANTSDEVSENIDLRNLSNEQLKNIGCIVPPENATEKESYKGIKFMETGENKFSDDEVAQLKYHIDLLPSKISAPGPRAIVLITPEDLGLRTFNQPIIAFADCSTIYITRNTFVDFTGNNSQDLDIVQRLMLREFVLVNEFLAVNQDKIKEIINDQSRVVDLDFDSDLVVDWAKNTGWIENLSSDNVMQGWDLDLDADNLGTTLTGAFSPSEDLAESVAVYSTGENILLSDDRITQLKKVLEIENSSEVQKGYLPIPSGMEVTSAEGFYEIALYNDYKKNFERANVAVYRNNDEGKYASYVESYKALFENREWTIDKWELVTDANGVKILKGTASYAQRQVDITITTYDEASGYAIKPGGTIVSVISGYDF